VGQFRANPVTRLARAAGASELVVQSRDDPRVEDLVAQLKPDLICVTGYPWLLGERILAAAPLGAINLHGSLLPRHRGILPLFWIYFHDDRETGVTLHWMTGEFDGGDIALQDRFTLPRGYDVEQLNHTNAHRGATLMKKALDDIAAGRAERIPQDATEVTLAPRIRPGSSMVDFNTWPVERVWHFLAGLSKRFREPLRDEDGNAVRYGRILGFTETRDHKSPGIVERRGRSYALHCNGGIVHMTARKRLPFL